MQIGAHKLRKGERLTRAVRGSVGDDGLSRGTGASLVGAVTDTVAEVGGVAVASVVARGASELGNGLVNHAINTSGLPASLASASN